MAAIPAFESATQPTRSAQEVQRLLAGIFGPLRFEATQSKLSFCHQHRIFDGGALLVGEGVPNLTHKMDERRRERRLSIFLVEKGRAHIRHAGQRYDLDEGQLAIFDQSQEILIEHLTPYRIRSLVIPRRYTPFFDGRQHSSVNRPIDTDLGAARILRLLASDMPEPSGPASTTAEIAHWNLTCTILSQVLRELMESDAAVPEEHWALPRIRAFLENNYRNEDLEQQQVADFAGVSLRTINRVLAGNGLSLARLILQVRLAHAQRLLGDPGYAAIPITTISHEVGFRDPAHFARVFRERIGIAPGEWRQAALLKGSSH